MLSIAEKEGGAHAAATKSAPNHRLLALQIGLVLGCRDRGAGAGGVIRSRSAALCLPVFVQPSSRSTLVRNACSRRVPYQSITKSRARALGA